MCPDGRSNAGAVRGNLWEGHRLTKDHRLQVRVPKDLHRRARIKSAETGRPLAEIVRVALRRWVEGEDDFQPEGKPKES